MNGADSGLKRSPFRVWDIVVYALIAALIALLFVAVRPEKSGAIEVLVSGERMMLVDPESGNATIYSDAIIKTADNKYRINAGGGFNEITVDPEKGTVFVSDADCGGDCLSMSLSGGAIICAPHGLVVKYAGEDLSPKVG